MKITKEILNIKIYEEIHEIQLYGEKHKNIDSLINIVSEQ